MFKKLIVFAITSGLAAKAFRAYQAKRQSKPVATTPVARPTAPRYTRRTD